MKKIFGFILTVAVAAMISTSCTKTCDPGYEGSKCTTEMRTKLIGSWTASDSCVVNPATGAPIPYTVINNTAGITDVQEFNITNVANQGVTIKAKMATSTTFTIPTQSVAYGAATVTVSGDGSISSDNMTVNLTYAVTAITSVTCKVVLTK